MSRWPSTTSWQRHAKGERTHREACRAQNPRPDLRYRYAQTFIGPAESSPKPASSTRSLKKQPQLISAAGTRVVQAFQQARKEAELIEVLGEIGLKSLGQPYLVTNVISMMMRNPQGKTAGLTLFRKPGTHSRRNDHG